MKVHAYFSEVVCRIANILQVLGLPAVVRNFKVVSIMATTNTGSLLDLARLATENPERVIYDPERPPIRASYRLESSSSAKAYLFHTGKVS
jgi:TATA-box binding protein (TBP) (component of TFIID and TFIIIB)